MLNANWERVPNTNFNYPNITIYDILADGVCTGYEARPNEGYVMYSLSNDVITDINPETGEEITNTYYCRLVGLPLNYNFDNFDYIAVLESDVPADNIFGDGDNKTEKV